MFEQRGNIAGDKIFAFAEADNCRRAEPSGDNFVGIAGGKKNQCINSAQLFKRFADRLFQRDFSAAAAFQILLDKVRDDFSVGFGDEFVAFALQLFLQFEVVLNDAVVHHHDSPCAVPVWVRVFLGGTPMGGPACVADAVGSFDWRFLDDFFQIAQLAGSAANFQFAGGVHHRDPSGVIAAIFQFAQPFNDDRNNFFGADVAHDSAHAANLLNQYSGRNYEPELRAFIKA